MTVISKLVHSSIVLGFIISDQTNNKCFISEFNIREVKGDILEKGVKGGIGKYLLGILSVTCTFCKVIVTHGKRVSSNFMYPGSS